MTLRSFVLTSVLICASCGDDPATTASSSSTPAKTSTAKPSATTSSSAAPSDKMPIVVVDEQGPVVDGQRSILDKPGGMEKLARTVGELPINGREVPVEVIKKGKLTDVVALVKMLGEKGAPTVRIKSDSRGDLPKEIVVVPQNKMSGTPPPCALVAVITAKFDTSVWNIQGATAKRHAKGLAGPDLSIAGETMTKELKKCDSKVAFFSADDTLAWEYAHILAGAIRAADSEKKLEQVVLLDEVPVPGRAVKGLKPSEKKN